MKKKNKHTYPNIIEDNNTKFGYLTDYLKIEVLNEIIKDVRRDNDALILVDGGEGSGKTVLSGICCKYVDPSFNVDRMVFDVDQFMEAVNNLKDDKYKAIQYDEAVTGLYSTDFMKDDYKKLIKLLSMGRKRNLIIFMCVPNIKLLGQHLITHRANGLIHVYKREGQYRGKAKYYNRTSMQHLYYQLKKMGNIAYSKVNADIHIDFTSKSVEHFKSFIDMEEYEKKKDEAINKIGGDSTGNVWKDRFIEVCNIAKEKGATITEIAGKIGIPRPNVSKLMKGGEN